MRKLKVVIPHGIVACCHDVIDQGIRRFLPTGEVVEVSWGHRNEVEKGVWLAADESTARACGVKFDKSAIEKMTGKKAAS